MRHMEAELDEMDRPPVPEWLDALSHQVLGACIEVHRALGPGLLERMYEEAVCHELTLRGIPFRSQVPLAMQYKQIMIEGFRLDLVVDDTIIIELKSVVTVHDVFLAQLASYCKAFGAPLGLLVNFNVPILKQGMHRRLNRPALEQRIRERDQRQPAQPTPPTR